MHLIHMQDKLFAIFLLVSSCLAFFSCKKDERRYFNEKIQYGVCFNPVRCFIGLEPLNNEWISKNYLFKHANGKIFYRIDWQDKRITEVQRYSYVQKSIFIHYGTIIWETDVYASPEYFNSIDIHGERIKINKTLTYRYRFSPDVGWDYYFSTNINEKTIGFISKSQADSILRSWGLNRW